MRVLVVEDDAKVREAVGPCWGRRASKSWRPSTAKTFRRLGADAILCDVHMPERGGLDVLRALRPATSGVKVVAMSGGGDFHGTVDLLPMARCLVAVAVLYKPFKQPELRAAIVSAYQSPDLTIM
jgi:CheY-like chemotaxis protein